MVLVTIPDGSFYKMIVVHDHHFLKPVLESSLVLVVLVTFVLVHWEWACNHWFTSPFQSMQLLDGS